MTAWSTRSAPYLDTLASEPGHARLFLVEVYAAGPAAMARRTVIQQRIVDAIVDLLDARSEGGRLTCQVIVAAVSAMVTGPLVAGDTHAVRALGPPIVAHARPHARRRHVPDVTT